MQISTMEQFSHQDFLKDLNAVFQKEPQLERTVKFYANTLIPLEKTLRSRFTPSGGQEGSKNRIQTMVRLQKAETSLNQTQSALASTKNSLEIATIDRDTLSGENKILRNGWEQAQINVKQLTDSLDEKLKAISISEQDKSHLVRQIQQKTKDYNLLYESFMRDKNMLVNKLNELNDMQQKILERQKKLEQDRFYLSDEKKRFEEGKSKVVVDDKPVDKKQESKDINKLMTLEEYELKLKAEQSDVKKDSKKDITRIPLKKIVRHHGSEIYCITSSFNGSILATCGGDRLIKFYDPLNLKTLSQISSNSAQSIFVSLNLNYLGDRLIAGSTDKTVTIWDVQLGKQLGCYVGHGQKVNAVAFTNTKEKCVSGSNDRQFKVWDIQKGSNTLSINCGKSVKVITPNYSEPLMYTGLADGSIRIYSISQGTNPLSQIKGLIDYPISSISVSSNRNQILVGSQQGSVLSIMDLRTSKILKKFEDKDFFNGGESFRADYSPSEKFVLAGSYDGAILFWNSETEKVEAKLSGHEGIVTNVLHQPFTGIMSSVDSKGNLILWT